MVAWYPCATPARGCPLFRTSVGTTHHWWKPAYVLTNGVLYCVLRPAYLLVLG